MVRIYTRGGDSGETALFGGTRVSKSAPRIDAYGAVDELNALFGVARAHTDDSGLIDLLARLQDELHTVCADLANSDLDAQTPRIGPTHVEGVERDCDRLDAELPPLTQFILPGGTALAAWLHYARTVARRAERRVVELGAQERINADVVKYLNRLSDLLFLMARTANHRANAAEIHPQYGVS